MINTIPIGVIMRNCNGEIVDYNDLAKKILSLEKEELTCFDRNIETFNEDGTILCLCDRLGMMCIRDKCIPMFDNNTISIKKAKFKTLESMAILSEFRDNETGKHIRRTKLYFKFLLEKIKHKLDYTDDEIELMYNSSPLHDIGKVAIPDSILLKNSKLTYSEFEIMKSHSIKGFEALERVGTHKLKDDFLKFAREITKYHHEKWDGTGYPEGLLKRNIPISARVMAIVDVYDALRSERPYKKSYSHKKSMKIIQEGAGKHFDPFLVDILLEYNECFNEIFLANK